jgi:hypothetical protein
VSLLNALLARTFDLLLLPFRQLPPIVGLVVVSLATAIAMLLIFKRTSNQTRLAAVKRQIHASIFEIRLFNDDLRAIFRSQGEILRHNLTYLRLSIVPMLWMIVPLLLVIAQLQFHYGYAGLEIGQPVLLKAQVREGVTLAGGGGGPDAVHASRSNANPPAVLDAPGEIEVQTPAVWLPGSREVIWRIAPRTPGRFDVQLRGPPLSGAARSRVPESAALSRRGAAAGRRRGHLDQPGISGTGHPGVRPGAALDDRLLRAVDDLCICAPKAVQCDALNHNSGSELETHQRFRQEGVWHTRLARRYDSGFGSSSPWGSSRPPPPRAAIASRPMRTR